MPEQKKNAFEDSLAQLEALVTSLEEGDLSLEQSLQAFEQGVTLGRDCRRALEEAEQKVQLLTEKDGAVVAEPFAGQATGEDP